MQLFSFGFAAFWLITLFVYYLFPRFQWQILLAASLGFYFLYSGYLPLILITCAGIVWGGHLISRERSRKTVLKCILLLQVVILLFYKYYGKITGAESSIVVPLGISFFLLAAIGYCIDIYREQYAPERNYAKLLLFLCFFPSIIQGPINRYDKLKEELFKKHVFSYDDFCKGLQRFLWGVFKKLILVERLCSITEQIFKEPENYSGILLMCGVFLYAIELYADFSGYMDMVLGIGQTFGIQLPENFKRPYFSGTIAEFWRRWHITLGTWFKDYVMYSFVMSPKGRAIGKKIKKYNKRWGKLVPALIGTMIVWFLTGLWHGTSCGYILWGIYYGIIMCISLCMEDFWKKRRAEKLFFKTFLYRILCTIRTIVLVLVADILICAASWSNIKLFFKKLFFRLEIFDFSALQQFWTLTTFKNIFFILLGCIMLLTASVLQERYGSIRDLIAKKNIVLRWTIWYALIFLILLFGTYGAGYDDSTFMYQVF